jgi:hypothetical protein
MNIEADNKAGIDVPQKSKPAKKDLLRFEKPIYDVFSKDKYVDEKEFMIKKLM